MMRRLCWGLFLLFAMDAAQASTSLRLCLWDFPGLVSFDANTGHAQGVSVDFISNLSARSGYRFTLSEKTPPARCIKQLTDGDTDLVINVVKTGTGRPGIDYIPFAARRPDSVYLSAADHRNLEQVSELAAMRLVSIRNYVFHARVQPVIDAMPEAKHLKVNSVYAALEIIAKQRADAALLPAEQVKAVLQEHPQLADKIKEFSFPMNIVEPQIIYMAISAHCNCPAAVTAIRAAVEDMKLDGTTARILGGRMITEF